MLRMSWRSNQQSKPWPWPNAVYLEQEHEENLNLRGNLTSNKYENLEGQILDGTVYKNAFPIPGNHYIYKSKKSFKDKYAKNKAKFEKKAKLPPITEAMSEVSSKAGSTRSTHSWMIPRYNPDILSDVMASDESDSEDEDYTSGRSERKYRKSGRRSHNQTSSLRHVDVIRNVQATGSGPRAQPNNHNLEVLPLEKSRNSNETNQNYNGLHRSPMNGDAVLANQLMMNNGSIYKEKHLLGISQTSVGEGTTLTNQNWNDNTYGRQDSTVNNDNSRRQSVENDRRLRTSKNNCLITFVIIVIIFCLLGTAVAAYLLLRDAFDDVQGEPKQTVHDTTKYNIQIILKAGHFSTSLADNQNSEFTALEDKVCMFLSSVPLRDPLKIYECNVSSFRDGSILVDLDLYFRDDHITILKARNNSYLDIIALIQENINTEIESGRTGRTFVEKYNPSVITSETVATTTAATITTVVTTTTTITEAMDETSHVFPSMTEVNEETTNIITSSTRNTGRTTSFSEADSTVISSFQAISSSSPDINVSPTLTDMGSQRVAGSTSLS